MSKTSSKEMKTRMNGVLIIAIVVVIAAIAFVISRATNQASSATAKMTPAEYQAQFSVAAADHLLLDVRTPEEFASGHIPGAVNISVDALASRLSELPTNQPIVVYCRSGNRSVTASQILAEAGYTSIYDLGGIIAWEAAGLPVE
jgi:rhodanese-related sulfurtransferase